MTLKGKRKNQPVDAATAANCSDEMAAVLATSYNLAKDSAELAQNALDNNCSRKSKILLKKLDELHQAVTVARGCEILTLAQAHYYLAYFYFTSKFKGRFHITTSLLAQSIKLLDVHTPHPESFMTTMRVYKFLGFAFIKHKKFEHAREILETAVSIYELHMKNNVRSPLVDLKCMTEQEEKLEVEKRLQMLYTALLCDLIHICHLDTCQESDRFKVLEYQHALLEVYLKQPLNQLKGYGFITISLDLAKSLVALERFTEARDHIAAACFVLSKISRGRESRVLPGIKWRTLTAEVNLSWANYGNRLLQVSSKRLFGENQKYSEGPANAKSASAAKSEEILLPTLQFGEIGDELKCYTLLITDKFISDYDSAKDVFASVLNCLNLATEFNLAKSDDLDAQIILHIAEAYKQFAYYESTQTIQLRIYSSQDYYLNKVSTLSDEKCRAKSVQRIVFLKNAALYSSICDCHTEYDDCILAEDYEPFVYEKRKEKMMYLAQMSLLTLKGYLRNSK